MKYTIFPFILLCTLFTLIPIGCERTELQKSEPNDSAALETRSDCDACPETDECCCGIELQFPFTTTADLSICGTSNLTGSCSGGAVGSCDAFSNGGDSFILDPNDPRKLFCMFEGNAFWIANTSSTNTAYVRITCQGDLVSPQFIYITIPPNTRYYYSANNNCELGPCE